MAILIKNPEVERKARELASLRGLTITAALDGALDMALTEATSARKRRPTLEEMIEATDRFRNAVGLDQRKLNVTREDFDALWEKGPEDER